MLHRVFGGVGQCLQLVHDLPDPGGGTHGASQKWQDAIENCPAGVFKRGPSGLGVRYRLSVSQRDQGVGVGVIQRGEQIATDGIPAQFQRSAQA